MEVDLETLMVDEAIPEPKVEKFDIERLDKINIDFNNDKIIDDFVNAVDHQLDVFRVKASDVGLEKVAENRKAITKMKNKVANYFKDKREFYNQMSKKIIGAEKKANEPFILLEEKLKIEVEAEEVRLQKEARRQVLPMRVALLEKHDLHIDEDVLLKMTDMEFMDKANEMVAAMQAEEFKILEAEKAKAEQARLIAEAQAKAKAEAEAKALIEKEQLEQKLKDSEAKAIKDAEIALAEAERKAVEVAAKAKADYEAKLEAERKASEAKVLKEKQDAEAQAKAKAEAEAKELKDKKVKAFLKSHNYVDDGSFKIAQNDGKVALWKLVGVMEI